MITHLMPTKFTAIRQALRPFGVAHPYPAVMEALEAIRTLHEAAIEQDARLGEPAKSGPDEQQTRGSTRRGALTR